MFLCHFLALFVQRRIFPTRWMRAPIEPVHKVGTPSLPLVAHGGDGSVAVLLSVPICVSSQLGHQITPTTISAYGTARLTRLTSWTSREETSSTSSARSVETSLGRKSTKKTQPLFKSLCIFPVTTVCVLPYASNIKHLQGKLCSSLHPNLQ